MIRSYSAVARAIHTASGADLTDQHLTDPAPLKKNNVLAAHFVQTAQSAFGGRLILK